MVEWQLCSRDKGKADEFDDASLIEWGKHNKIKSLKEYGSTLPKYNPLK